MNTMKTLAILLLLVLSTPVVSADTNTGTVLTKQIVVTDSGSGFWSKVVKYATLGLVQSGADAIKANQPFALAWDHDGVDTASYIVSVNTQQYAVIPVSALQNGTAQVNFPEGLPKGTYTLTVKAIGEGGESGVTPLALSVTAGNPSNPRNPRIIK